MNTCVIGPLCRDEVIIEDDASSRIGGVTYYAGEALKSLSVNTTVFASFSDDLIPYVGELNAGVKQISCEETIQFVNKYPDMSNPDERVQECRNNSNHISLKDFINMDFNEFDYVILGPLFHDNISTGLIRLISRSNTTLVLAVQGLIRYSEEGRVVWKHPERVVKTLPYVDYLFLDEEELSFISQNKGVRFLQENGVENVIVTNGMNGSKLYLKGEVFDIRAFKPGVLKDPTGAGDSYMAGFIKGLELYDDAVRLGEFAAMTATMNIEKKGAFESCEEEVKKRLGMI